MILQKVAVPQEPTREKQELQHGQTPHGCRWSAGFREPLLAICLYPSRKTGAHRATAVYGIVIFPPTGSHHLCRGIEPVIWVYEQVVMFMSQESGSCSCSQTCACRNGLLLGIGGGVRERGRYTIYSHFLPQLPQEHWGNLRHLTFASGLVRK